MLRISVAQVDLACIGTLDDYLRRLHSPVRAAADAGSTLVLLPEMISLGLLALLDPVPRTRADMRSAMIEAERRWGDEVVGSLRSLASREGVTVAGATMWISEEKAGANVGFVFMPDGSIVRQHKLTLTRGEIAIETRPGRKVHPFRIEQFTAAMLICADIEVPELGRAVAASGVDLILCPSYTSDARGAERVRVSARARAHELGVYVAVAPLVGCLGVPTEHPYTGVGNGLIAAPIDRTSSGRLGIVSEVLDDGEGIATADLDIAQLRTSHELQETPRYPMCGPTIRKMIDQATMTEICAQ